MEHPVSVTVGVILVVMFGLLALLAVLVLLLFLRSFASTFIVMAAIPISQVGGLLVSTVFTLFLIPALLSLVLDARQALARAGGREFRA
jgi:multidrug efflux pump subunit AcrB